MVDICIYTARTAVREILKMKGMISLNERKYKCAMSYQEGFFARGNSSNYFSAVVAKNLKIKVEFL